MDSTENIAEMAIVGTTTDLEPPPEYQTEAPEIKKKGKEKEVDPNVPPECIICLEVPRSVLLEPCNHYALCEPCAKQVQKSDRRECPLCRVSIKGVKKDYMI